ncbi:MAG: periplasmic heavy metal sensor [Pseudomonadota bacterium]
MTEGSAPDRPSGRWQKPLLIVSLALNLAVAGLILGAVVRNDGMPPGPSSAAFGLPYMKALEREDRRAIFQRVRAAGGETLPDRAARRALSADVLGALRADPFIIATLQSAVASQASASVAFQQAAQTAWIEHVAAMSASERADYVQAVEQELARLRRPGKKR